MLTLMLAVRSLITSNVINLKQNSGEFQGLRHHLGLDKKRRVSHETSRARMFCGAVIGSVTDSLAVGASPFPSVLMSFCVA